MTINCETSKIHFLHYDKLQPFEPWKQALASVLGCNLSTRNESRIRDYKYRAIKILYEKGAKRVYNSFHFFQTIGRQLW